MQRQWSIMIVRRGISFYSDQLPLSLNQLAFYRMPLGVTYTKVQVDSPHTQICPFCEARFIYIYNFED